MRGLDLERLIGHLVFISQLRRERLSCFDKCYAFIAKDRDTEAQLWGSALAALEMWDGVSSLLMCEMRSPWAEGIYCVDASPWGLGCFRACFGKPQCAAYESGIERGLFALGLRDFPEVSRRVMEREWVVIGRHVLGALEPMPVLEARAMLYALRHAARSQLKRSKRLLLISDSLTMSSCFSMGRSSAPAMLAMSRAFAALSLAFGTSASCRWGASAWNPADGPSRGGWRSSPLGVIVEKKPNADAPGSRGRQPQATLPVDGTVDMLCFWPHLKGSHRAPFPRVVQALRGWRKVAPPQSCQPLPFEVMAMGVHHLCAEGREEAGL